MDPFLASLASSRSQCFAKEVLRNRWGHPTYSPCQLDAGHDGAHCLDDPQKMECAVSQRYVEHGTTHRVAWFGMISGTRMLWTACGRYYQTTNRTKNRKVVTCIRCAACP